MTVIGRLRVQIPVLLTPQLPQRPADPIFQLLVILDKRMNDMNDMFITIPLLQHRIVILSFIAIPVYISW